MSRIIEAKAVISGEDRLSKVLDGLNRKMQSVGKGMRVSADVDRLNKSLADAKRGLEAIDRLRDRQSSFSASRTKFRGAEADVARIARELDAARKAAAEFDGIRAFGKNSAIAKEMGDARRRVTELEASLRSSQRAVKAASGEFENQAAVLKDAKAAAEAAGVSVGKLGLEERRLKANVDATNFAIEKRKNHERNHGPAGAPPPAVLPRASRPARSGEGGGEAGTPLSGASALRFGRDAIGVGAGAFVVGDQLRRAAKSSMDFERAMIEVGKATDASGPELDAYGEKVLSLARATGKTKEDLASMLSQAGFAGRPKQELMDFTEYAAKATVAWQTSAEDTGQALAEIGNIYEANQKRIEQIGDAINTMADNSASKETDLLEFMRRAGASSRQAGISAEHMLAFGAALKEVGVRNEVAATGFEALLNVMKLGAEFSKKAGEGLKELGVNSTKMRKSFVTKPIETTIDLLEKLNNVADPLKKAEIMTNLFGKEYQDDIAKLLNALPKLKQYIGLMSDADKLKAGGVRFQFAQNLDKDVSKIDRATQAIDVLYKRIGDPIKVQAGGVADQINAWVERLEHGDTVAQRLLKRLTGDDKDKKDDKPKANDGDPMGRVVTTILRQIDPKFGKTLAEQAAMDREAAATAEAERDRTTLAKPAELEGQIQRRQAVLERAREQAAGAPGIQRDMAREQVWKSEAEIARLKGELEKAWDAIGEMRVRQEADRGAFGLEGPAGKDRQTIGTGGEAFGFGLHGIRELAPRDVPLPPARPPAFGPSSRDTPAPGTVPVEVVRLPDGTGRDAVPPAVPAKTLPEPADPARGFPNEQGISRGVLGDWVFGPEIRTQQLPGFGIGDKTIPVEVKAMPPDARLDAGSHGAGVSTMPDQRLEATVKPDQITARVDSLPPISGEATVTVENHHQITVTLNTEMLDAKVNAAAGRAVANLPLSSGAARPGAATMPGAAAPPGNR